MEKIYNLRNGTVLVLVESPGGIYNSAQLKTIASLSDRDSTLIKATEDQRVAMMVPQDQYDSITKELLATGLGVRKYQDGLHQPICCLGNLCSLHEQDALGLAMDITQELSQLNLEESLKIGINGCSACCIPSHTLDISIIGDMEGYRLSLGGKNSQIPEMATFMAERIPAKELPKLINNIITVFLNSKENGETLQDVINRIGATPFIKILEPYSCDAASSDDLGSLDEAQDSLIDKSHDNTEAANENLDIDPSKFAESIHEMQEEVSINSSDGEIDNKPVENSSLSAEEAEQNEKLAPMTEDELSAMLEEDEGSDSIQQEKSVARRDDGIKSGDLNPENKMETIFDEDLTNSETLGNSENEEDEFEKKLNESIVEEEKAMAVQEDQATRQDRIDTLRLVENIKNKSPSSTTAPTDFSQEITTSEETMSTETTEGILEEEIFEDEVIEPVTKGQSEKGPTKVKQIQQKPRGIEETKKKWGFAGISTTSEGKVVVHFDSGAEIILDLDKIVDGNEMTDFQINNQHVMITPEDGKLRIEVEGLGVLLPLQAA